MFLALHEIRRAKTRFALLGGAVGLLVFVLLFFQSVSGALVSSLTGAVERLDADVLVFADDARRNIESSLIPDGALEAVRAADDVAAAEPVGEAVFTVRVAGELADAAVFGVRTDGPGAPTSLADGRLPAAEGEATASATDDADGFDLGDTVTLEPGGTTLEIVGLADDARYSALPTLYVTYATYGDALRARGAAGEIVPPKLLAVQVTPGADPPQVAAALTAQVDGIEALDLDTAVASLPAVSQISQSFAILYFLLYLVVGLVTGVFFLILTVQKRESLVLLRAVGARRRDLVVPLLVQVAAVVGVGVLVGAGLAGPAVGAAGEGLGATFDPSAAALSAVVVLGLGALGATAAVRRVLHIEPVEATRPEEL